MMPATTSARPATAPMMGASPERMCSPSRSAPSSTLAIGLAAVSAGSDQRIGPLWNALCTRSTANSSVPPKAYSSQLPRTPVMTETTP